MAIFKDRRNSVIISIKVGNVLRSVGFGIYIEINIINTEIDSESAKKKSSTGLGSGTMIIAKIAIITKTTVRLLAFTNGAKNGATIVNILRFANFTS
ncbi:hypothetical protein CFVB10_05175 [Campylobacter fetus subsp. venerealis cfvB10]|nr:hypothetical protein CFVB10_05175 [Campylobacter fetus subsp. venerealis cfvB10]